MTYRQLLKETWDALRGGGIEAAQMEGYLLLQGACGVDRTHYPILADTLCPQAQEERLRGLLARRLTGEPVQYILGKWEFYGYEFYVGEGVLIPRADTELLVETALSFLEQVQNPVIADLCSGSGCIAISLQRQRRDARVYACELSEPALGYLRRNLILNQCEEIKVLPLDVLEVPPEELQNLDIIVSNPPYIPTGDLAGLQREVQREPKSALDGDGDGLRFYRGIPAVWKSRLRLGGALAFEIGFDQGEAVAGLLRGEGFTEVRILQDLAGLDRVVFGRKA